MGEFAHINMEQRSPTAAVSLLSHTHPAFPKRTAATRSFVLRGPQPSTEAPGVIRTGERLCCVVCIKTHKNAGADCPGRPMDSGCSGPGPPETGAAHRIKGDLLTIIILICFSRRKTHRLKPFHYTGIKSLLSATVLPRERGDNQYQKGILGPIFICNKA